MLCRTKYHGRPSDMSQGPAEFTVEIQPRARFDAIDVRGRIASEHGNVLAEFPRALYCSFHTTAGYLEQPLATRLSRGPASVSELARPFAMSLPAVVQGSVATHFGDVWSLSVVRASARCRGAGLHSSSPYGT